MNVLNRTTRLHRLIAAALLSSSGLHGGTAASASESSSPTLPRLLSACNSATGVSGAVTDGNGMPVAGAPVILHAEPQARKTKPGDRVRLRLLGWTRTDGRGCYDIQLSPAGGRDRALDLRITLQRQGSLELVSISHAAGAGAVHQSFGPQADRARQRHGRAVGPSPDATPFALAGDTPLLRGDTEVLKVYAKRPVLVGQWFSSMKGVRQVWRYTRGATTSLSSGFSQTGRAGSYSRSMTFDRSAQATVAFPVARGKAGNYYRSYFRYAKYVHWYCDGVACGAAGYTIKPYSWERGTQVTTGLRVPAVKRRNCSPYRKGSSDSVTGSKAVTWANGVSIGGDLAAGLGLNLSLSAQTGFTSAAQNLVTFQRRGFLCGVFGPLGGRPGMLVARQFAR